MSRNVHSLYDQPAEHTPGSAVIYLRVSTKEQAAMGGEAEGYSLPAQREACLRKAEGLGVQVVAEFVERGESGTTTNRPELQRLLGFIQEEPVNSVIVHKVDRLARSRADDAIISLQLQQAGVRLISCTESIDETPSGMLLHGIMASIAEFYSRNLANEVVKGSVQKVKGGGTVGKAPIGYLNARETIDGRETRTVIVDPERAPLMRFAFEAYATGEWRIRRLAQELEERGLRTVPGPNSAAKILSVSQLHRCLRNPYYKGIVRYKGVAYPGKHEPLVTAKLWDAVQGILDANDHAGVKERKHHHYLKGSVFCGQCGSRLIISNSKNRWGTVYPYFICIGRQEKRTNCTQKALLIEQVESAIEDYYSVINLSRKDANAVRDFLTAELSNAQMRAEQELQQQRVRVKQLERERYKLLETYYADAIPIELFKSEQKRISDGLDAAQRVVDDAEVEADVIEANLAKAMQMLPRVQSAYLAGGPEIRRRYNQGIFVKLKIDEGLSVAGELTGLWQALLRPELVGSKDDLPASGEDASERPLVKAGARLTSWVPLAGQGLSLGYLVGEVGLEPT